MSCSRPDKAPDNSRVTSKDTRLETPHINQDSVNQKLWERIFFRDINERIEDTDIKNLRNQEMSPNSREIRLWASFNPLRGIILRQNEGGWSALYIPALDSASNSLMAPRPLPLPHSGWISLWEKLEGLGIYTLPDAVDIGADNSYPDAKVAVIEIKTPDSYRTYMYNGLDTAKAPESKKALEICNTLSSEFGVQLY
jgi:hypothetical protein